jgi:hypothetical protein
MKPPAEINAEVVLPSGDRIRWDSASPDAGNRPLDPQIETVSGKGFGAGSVILTRPVDRDYAELGLLNELILRTATGKTVYQGRAQGVPVSDTWQFDCDGWWSHGEQRTMTELLVDRDLNAWGEWSLVRRSLWINIGLFPIGTASALPDASTGAPGLHLTVPNGSSNAMAEAWYDAGPGAKVASIYYDLISKSVAGDTGLFRGLDDDGFGGEVPGTDYLTGANSSAAGTFTHATPKRYTTFSLQGGATAASAERSVTLRKLTVIGDHGIPTVTTSDGTPGVTASDSITYLANKYAPKWDTSGVGQTSYPIPHAVWRDPITPAEAIKQLNSYHLWKLGVWEDRRLEFAPYDLSVAKWQVANGQDGVRVEYQGDTTENVFNGCAVTFNDFAGKTQRLTPDDTDDLKDEGEWIAANQWGDTAWLDIQVSWPCTADDAAQIGSIALASANQARRPSTITVPMHIKDIHGSWWPSSYVRADETILVTNQHTPVPRLITGTRWANHSLTITTDNAIDSMSAFNQRVGGALSAAGLV